LLSIRAMIRAAGAIASAMADSDAGEGRPSPDHLLSHTLCWTSTEEVGGRSAFREAGFYAAVLPARRL
jgi:hypothetical protein